ncbi:Pentatricopeptide repeat-containing protein, chloroplastic, partial [Frankliniella fusca]
MSRDYREREPDEAQASYILDRQAGGPIALSRMVNEPSQWLCHKTAHKIPRGSRRGAYGHTRSRGPQHSLGP